MRIIHCRSGIRHSFSPAYTPECNGRAEDHNRVLSQTTRALMADQQIPLDLWPEVARYAAAYLLNRRPRRIHKRYVIPYEEFTGREINVKHLRIIGSPVSVLIKPKPVAKFAERSEKGMLLGYVSDGRGDTCVYRVLLHASGQIASKSDVVVLEPSLRTLQLAAGRHLQIRQSLRCPLPYSRSCPPQHPVGPLLPA